ncbi:DUF1289 domain-containing protein [Kordiimonas marina]|uniref:DUF1289 domain-containing protein n=1 Tax=Kordiimonas marina TaxID=2872312 RepID=UPI001FF56B30|nr:DUF1289 domain-containing protein [Kordiimonas marina]MCJ9429931.1 DUF1289 domain-containing protein [Kordiimonas marina]
MTTEIPSPCIDVCRLDAAGEVCVGCFRNLSEIGQWAAASPDEKRAILIRAARRKNQVSGKTED